MELFKFRPTCQSFYYLLLLNLLTACHHYIDIQPSRPPITEVPKRVVLLLPLQGEWKPISEAIKSGFEAANLDSKTPIHVTTLDTTCNASIQKTYIQGTKLEADLIIGPLLKSEVATLANLQTMKTPVLTLNYLDTQIIPPANFYQFGLSPNDEAKQAAKQAYAHHHRQALVIVPENKWGHEMAHAFTEKWEDLGGKVVGRLNYTPSLSNLNDQIRTFLDFEPPQHRRTDFDVIFLGATSELGRQINPLLAFYFAANVPTYACASIYDKTVPLHLNRDLDAIIICDAPWNLETYQVKTHLSQQLETAAPLSFKIYARYYALGVDAFSLAQQLHQLDQSHSKTIIGASGLLSLNPDRYIVREPLFAQFKRGIPKLITNSLPILD